jgi:NADH-quinone oxidoreductase subunit J
MAKNPVQSVLLLVLVFLQTALLFILLGAEFLAILLITVYIGAIAILFLFVVMLLNLRVVELHSSLQYHIPIGIFLGLIFFFVLAMVCSQELKNFSLTSFAQEDYFVS